MTDTFKPVVEGMEFHVIDGTGFPDAVLVSNGVNVMDGTYIDKYYYPVVHAHWKNIGSGHAECSNCGMTVSADYPASPCVHYCAELIS